VDTETTVHTAREPNHTSRHVMSVVIFLIIAAAGLFYVKWYPYYHKAFLAASHHSIGASIVTGKSAVAPPPSWNTAAGYALAYFKAVWQAIVLGIVLGSLVQVLVPKNWLLRLMGREGLGSSAIAGLAALPGMMCTCCAAPVAVGLRKQEASISSALAFWLGNPTLNPATLIFMGFVLSWKFVILRIVMGAILVFGVSGLAGKWFHDEKVSPAIQEWQAASTVESTGNFWMRWGKSLLSMILGIIPAYVLSVLVVGAVRAWLFPHIGPAYANHILTIVGLAVAGTLFVIPTAAEIPIVQTFMKYGLGTGPAASLIMTLPAISLPSLLLVSRSFPPRVLLFVTVSVVVLGIVSGLLAMVWM
jgi:uncharacterized membrane protein YraQ (UPF0718 family)